MECLEKWGDVQKTHRETEVESSLNSCEAGTHRVPLLGMVEIPPVQAKQHIHCPDTTVSGLCHSGKGRTTRISVSTALHKVRAIQGAQSKGFEWPRMRALQGRRIKSGRTWVGDRDLDVYETLVL
jgi:hypothetical protein